MDEKVDSWEIIKKKKKIKKKKIEKKRGEGNKQTKSQTNILLLGFKTL